MLHLTPDILEASYEMLRLTPPFRGWKLPHADDLEFRVTTHVDRYGHYDDKRKKGARRPPPNAIPDISISSRCVKDIPMLLEVMAHEMIHLRRHRLKRKGWETHGVEFNRLADQVCRYHGFKRDGF